MTDSSAVADGSTTTDGSEVDTGGGDVTATTVEDGAAADGSEVDTGAGAGVGVVVTIGAAASTVEGFGAGAISDFTTFATLLNAAFIFIVITDT